MQQTLQKQRYENGTVLYMALELSKKYWKIGFTEGVQRREVTVAACDRAAVLREIGKAKQKFGLAENCAVVSGYEAGRDGFWIHRWLLSEGIENRVMDASSFEMARRRQAKTDHIDLRKLLELLVSEGRGERRYRAVRVPSEAAEVQRRPQRERETLLEEQNRHRNRLTSLLATQGITLPLDRQFLARLEELTDWQGRALDQAWRIEFKREWQRLALVEAQLKEIEQAQQERLQSGTDLAAVQMRALSQLKGLGLQIPSLLVHELFAWRRFRNGRELGGIAGLTPTPYASGELKRELGISKHGIPRVRKIAVELAWLWVRYQPESVITKWFEARFARGGKRQRRIGIVAVARKLLIALWRYLETGVVPDGAIIKA